jgi:hypothetical protein
VWLALARWGISRVFLRDTTERDKVHRPLRDLGVIRGCVGGVSLWAAGVWWWVLGSCFSSGGGLAAWREVFVPVGLPRSMDGLAGFAAAFLRWDEVFGMGSVLVWLGYLFWDLRAAGMLREGWLTVVGLGVVSVFVVGPGATVGLGWLWREQILATRRHKDALTLESVGRLHGSAL